MRTPLAAITLLLALAAPALADNLPTFLAAASAVAPSQPLRADGTLVTTSPDGEARDQIAIVRRPNGDLYLELRSAGARALLLADGKTALIVPGKGKGSEAFAMDAGFAGSEFTREDLRPFTLDNFRSPTIVDRREGEVTVSLTPNDSQYTLQVITFDTEKKVPLVAKNYKETISNLVRMSRAKGFTDVAGLAVPADVTMENFPLRAVSTMTLKWQPTQDTPGLFDPAALDKPSTLTWPAQ